MKLNTLKPAEGSKGRVKRVGRGPGSGRGKTASRGNNGAKSRSGYSRKAGFEGGQMPIQRRLPKFGFNNPTRVEYKAINLSSLQTACEKHNLTTVDIDTMISIGLAGKNDLVKILGNGELTAKLDVTANAFSASAIKKIEDAGGTANKI
ncbi:MAG TPA: 50S ribosomal protein L15 [Bacteroidales bacterium]|jgi:large subunit ribosomal protein L15|nr:50S ribosomal protein L15 [Bacteroidales bacterium]HPB88687.1 50S ribosomal protein L15 [Bacteroidales bacterium]HPH53862.1 50S ribosomal protein L15 [Bacteroidales bacterium]HPY22108.1 50S ribosomal protein L15 [Bacteroidales bacterium]HQA92795.1 50S ribosomal protein L15 [Bacteroidales bacterium]